MTRLRLLTIDAFLQNRVLGDSGFSRSQGNLSPANHKQFAYQIDGQFYVTTATLETIASDWHFDVGNTVPANKWSGWFFTIDVAQIHSVQPAPANYTTGYADEQSVLGALNALVTAAGRAPVAYVTILAANAITGNTPQGGFLTGASGLTGSQHGPDDAVITNYYKGGLSFRLAP